MGSLVNRNHDSERLLPYFFVGNRCDTAARGSRHPRSRAGRTCPTDFNHLSDNDGQGPVGQAHALRVWVGCLARAPSVRQTGDAPSTEAKLETVQQSLWTSSVSNHRAQLARQQLSQ